MGLGAIWDKCFYSVTLPLFVKCQNRIVVFEMLNILVAFRVWGKLWSNKRILIWCDNRAVVNILGRNMTRDSELGAILREILMVQACGNVQFVVRHVSGEGNPIADALSRVHIQKSVQCRQDLIRKGCIEYEVNNSVFILNLEL